MTRPGPSWAVALLLTTVIPAALAAQGAAARVAGTVKDDSGKPVSGATITAANHDEAPATYTTTSDTRGRFGMLGLRRGVWMFTVEAPGFQAVRASGEVQTLRPNAP